MDTGLCQDNAINYHQIFFVWLIVSEMTCYVSGETQSLTHSICLLANDILTVIMWYIRCFEELLQSQRHSPRAHHRLPWRSRRRTVGDSAWTWGQTASGLLLTCRRGIPVRHYHHWQFSADFLIVCVYASGCRKLFTLSLRLQRWD